MACHEIAALRLGLMQILGRHDEAERQHELAELGAGAEEPGPVRALCGARDLATLKQLYESAVAGLEERVSASASDDAKLAYHRTLVVLTKKVELELGQHVAALTQLYRDLDEIHDFVHEIYPAG